MIVYAIIVLLLQNEVKEMTIPEYFRTHEELTKPFVSDESPVQKAGLKLVSVEIKELTLPETKLYQETGDAKLAAKLITEQTRAWSNSMFLSSKSNGKIDSRRKFPRNITCTKYTWNTFKVSSTSEQHESNPKMGLVTQTGKMGLS